MRDDLAGGPARFSRVILQVWGEINHDEFFWHLQPSKLARLLLTRPSQHWPHFISNKESFGFVEGNKTKAYVKHSFKWCRVYKHSSMPRRELCRAALPTRPRKKSLPQARSLEALPRDTHKYRYSLITGCARSQLVQGRCNLVLLFRDAAECRLQALTDMSGSEIETACMSVVA